MYRIYNFSTKPFYIVLSKIKYLLRCWATKRVFMLMPLSAFIASCAFLPVKDLPEYEYRQFESSEGTLLYRALPPANLDPNKKYPLVIVLHGAGERGSDNKRQLRNGAELFLGANREKYPALVLFPQVPSKQSWAAPEVDRSTRPFDLRFSNTPIRTKPMRKLYELIEAQLEQPWVDASRIYVIGFSMGAMGGYELLAEYPKPLAAGIMVCGGTSEPTAKKIHPTTPIWVIHGAKDNIVDVQHSLDAAAWIRDSRTNTDEQNAEVKLTVYPEAGHNSWNNAFEEPDLLAWLFSHANR